MAPHTPTANTLFYGDNLATLREHIADETVDLVYLDPPFNSNATYNVLFKSPTGEQSPAQMEAFGDTWHWDISAERAFDDVVQSGNSDAAELIMALRKFLGTNDMMAYLAMMAVRLIELHRVLKPTGSLYLHCDPTASHYLKIILDSVFGAESFGSEIVWRRSGAHNDSKQGRRNYGHNHDIIFYYRKSPDLTWNTIYTDYSEEYTGRDYRLVEQATGRRFRRGDLTAARPGGDVSYEWRVKKRENERERWIADLDDEFASPVTGWEYKSVVPYSGRYWAYSRENMRIFAQEDRLRHTFEGMPEFKRYLDEMPGIALQDTWTDIQPVVAGTAERLGYPTQKPVALLERIISASSNPGDLVLDPFCGCGTTVHAAQKLGRRWIGIDITHLSIGLITRRLTEAFPLATFAVLGTPKDLGAAQALSDADKHQFQLWVLSLIDNAQPYKGGKKGSDGGVDGYVYFKADKQVTEKAIVSVKGGAHVSDTMVKDLITTVEHEGAKMGLFLTLAPPTKPMLARAAAAGFYKTEYNTFPKVQILTIEELLDGKRPHMPYLDPSAFKKAKREEAPSTQGAFDL